MVTVVRVVTCPSPLPAEEIQLYINILDCVLLLSLYLHSFSSSLLSKVKALLKLCYCFFNLPHFFSCNATVLFVHLYFLFMLLCLSLWSRFCAKTPHHSSSQQWCNCPSAKLITQRQLKHFYFCALNSFSELVSWFVSLALICFVLWVQLLIC